MQCTCECHTNTNYCNNYYANYYNNPQYYSNIRYCTCNNNQNYGNEQNYSNTQCYGDAQNYSNSQSYPQKNTQQEENTKKTVNINESNDDNNKYGMGITVFPERQLAVYDPSLEDVPADIRRMMEKAMSKSKCTWRLSQLSLPLSSRMSKKYESTDIKPPPPREMKIEYEMLEHLSKSEPLWKRCAKKPDSSSKTSVATTLTDIDKGSDNQGVFPHSLDSYKCLNIGRTEVYCESWYGTAIKWHGIIVAYTLNPGDEKVFDNGNRLYYYTGLKVQNKDSKLRALVHVGYRKGWPWYDSIGPNWELKIDINDMAKALVSFGVGFIPKVGPVFSALVDFFWPETETDIWSEIESKVEALVDKKTQEAIRGIIGGQLRYMKEKINSLNREIEHPELGQDVNRHFMYIAKDLVGFEHHFSIAKEDNSDYVAINEFILPLYSNFVTMKVKYYQFGIRNADKLKLNSTDVVRLKEYLKHLLLGQDGVFNYINRVLHESVEKAYQTCDPDNVYDAIATARTYIGLNGLEFLDVWRAALEHTDSEDAPYNSAIIFSKNFCRPTPWHARQIVAEDVPQPLQPKMLGERRNRMLGVTVWIWRIRPYALRKISGLKIYWENGDESELGKWSRESEYIDFKGADLKALRAWGDGALDCLDFDLTDGRRVSVGSTNDARGVNELFELDKHVIAGILLSGGQDGLEGQACNISVSYRLASP
ncbi:unnamed protein product [Phyllotreta striolata]|uniref:Pesticidal crystal protein domain-containing protein n=1 Tax=Phyllotreta striolata TaxID=444603 RepID=A0A9N9TUQ9_PHYSR|nr:unnamed protein product [Phyllotreta striolata]